MLCCFSFYFRKVNTPNSSDSPLIKQNFISPKPFKPDTCFHEQLQINIKKDIEDVIKNNCLNSCKCEEMLRNLEAKYEEQYKLNLDIKEHLFSLTHEKENLNFSKMERLCCKKDRETLSKRKEKKISNILREKCH